MSVDAYVHHQLPGRVRIRVPAAKGDDAVMQQLSSAIAKAPGVSRVEYNPIIGSILIHYSAAEHASLDSLTEGMTASSVPLVLKRIHTPERHDGRRRRQRSQASRSVDSFFRQLDDGIRDATDNQFDLKFIMPLAVGTLGVLSLRQASATPLWLTLMIFAFHSFLGLHAPSGEAISAVENLAMELEA